MKRIVFFLILYILLSEDSYCQKIPEPDVVAMGVLRNGKEESVAEILVEEFLQTKTFALLNYIFFEKGSSKINDFKKYSLYVSKDETVNFNPEKQFFNYDVLDVYYDILNIVGYRMRQNESLTIKLQGCNSNEDIEKNNLELSKARALSVKQYLVNIWGIASNRIDILLPINLPEEPSTSQSSPVLSNEENRRVEIYGDWELMKPFVVTDTLVTANPPFIYFYTNMKEDMPVEYWELTVEQKGKELRKPFRDNGKPPDKIPWWINKQKEGIPRENLPIGYKLYVTAEYKGTSKKKLLPVVVRTISSKKIFKMESKEYSRYNLILFNFGKFSVTESNQKILELLKSLEGDNPEAKYFISGYTDIIGDKEYNRNLSEKRALETANELIKKSIIKKESLQTIGYGNSYTPYYNSAIERMSVLGGNFIEPTNIQYIQEFEENIDYNNSPEGRFYCRTVIIEIEKDVKYSE